MSFVLSCCSTADLTAEHFKERDIKYVCFHFNIDGKDYPDDLGVSYPFKKFYDDMAKGAMTKTSQVSVGEYIAYFEGFLKEGKDVLHLLTITDVCTDVCLDFLADSRENEVILLAIRL